MLACIGSHGIGDEAPPGLALDRPGSDIVGLAPSTPVNSRSALLRQGRSNEVCVQVRIPACSSGDAGRDTERPCKLGLDGGSSRIL